MFKGRVVSKAGKFYVGDICYAMQEELYRDVWGGKYGYKDGQFDIGDTSFAVASTKYGDGVYLGSDGHDYPVDAGDIGILSWELVDENSKDIYLGRVINAESIDYSFTGRDGSDKEGLFEIYFNNEILTIDTDNWGWE